eukprot:3364222-Prymnesium_polylepis.1
MPALTRPLRGRSRPQARQPARGHHTCGSAAPVLRFFVHIERLAPEGLACTFSAVCTQEGMILPIDRRHHVDVGVAVTVEAV